MRRVTACVGPADTLGRAAERMTALEVRELPVLEGDHLRGIVTRSDLLPYRGHFEWTLVREAMTPNPVTVTPDASLAEVAALLLDRRINAVPVVEGDRLLGMVGRTDLLRPLARSIAGWSDSPAA